MKEAAIRLTLCAVFGALLWFGFVEDVQGAANIVTFYVWAMLPLAILMWWGPKTATSVRPANSVEKLLMRTTNIGALILLIWTGHPWTAGAWAFAMLFTFAHGKQKAGEVEA